MKIQILYSTMRKQQIKLTESKILEAINDVLTDYENKSRRPTARQTRSEIDKYFIDDLRFDDIVNEAITNFMRSKTGKKFSKIREEEIDSPRFYGYDIDKHLGDVSPEQKKSDNEWSYEHAFDSSRNLGVIDGTIDSERLQSILDLPNANDSMDMRMTPSKYPYWVWSDENRNILDRHGRYSMCSQSDIPHVQEYGKGARDTLRATNAQRNQ